MKALMSQLRSDWSYLRARGLHWEAMRPVVLWMVGVVVLMGLMVGCTAAPPVVGKPCGRCMELDTHIQQAEQFMNNHATTLVYPGDWTEEFKAQYSYHKRWIDVRDAMTWEQRILGEVEGLPKDVRERLLRERGIMR